LYENNVHTYLLITEGFAIMWEDVSMADLFVEPWGDKGIVYKVVER
jgi:hypothetical protein